MLTQQESRLEIQLGTRLETHMESYLEGVHMLHCTSRYLVSQIPA